LKNAESARQVSPRLAAPLRR